MARRALLLVITAALALGLTVAPTPDLAQSGFEPQLPVSSGDAVFDAWRTAFIEKAVAKGLPRERVSAELADLVPDPHLLALDKRQPEFSKPIGDYLASTVADSRVKVAQGKRAAVAPFADAIADKNGVPVEVLVAVWGIESSFGTIQGSDDVVRALATLAAEGRRKDFAESQLIGALRIIISGEAGRGQLKGSWAGAMGQTQFTPLDYLSFAVDGDGDGRRDIWGSAPDALASTANFLQHKAAWRRGESWAREVVLPQGFDYALSENGMKNPAAWMALGVRTADGTGFSPADQASTATLLLPQGWRGPAFLAFPNHMAIRAYNNSTAYALAVGLLADRIAGRPGVIAPWPADRPISLDDRMAAQAALARLGFDPGGQDGVLGRDTRKAARLWQASVGLPVDGYLSFDLVQQLKAQAQQASVVPTAGPPGL